MKIKVVELISYAESEKYEESIGGMGGWFDIGMRWNDYAKAIKKPYRKYVNAIRKFIIENKLRFGGDGHQSYGVPLFNDNTVGSFSFRAWGDLMAAIWSSEDKTDYTYMSFYMDCLIKPATPKEEVER